MNRAAWLMVHHTKSGSSRSFRLKTDSPGPVTVGRRTSQDPPDKLSVPFDPYLSRAQFTIDWNGLTAHILRDPSARLPIYLNGKQVDEFDCAHGDFFVIGNTRWTLLAEEDSCAGALVADITDEHMEQVKQNRAELCLRALSALQLIEAGRPSVEDFLLRIPPLVLEILPGAHTTMSLRINAGVASDEVDSIDILARASRSEDMGEIIPSRTMAAISLRSLRPEAYTWPAAADASMPTACFGVGWAVCAPVKVSENEHYALYAMGESVEGSDPMGEMDRAVLALMAEMTSRYLETQFLQRLEGQLIQYFPPALRKVLMDDPRSDRLSPALHDATVLFFDLRGFSRVTEMAELSADEEDERALFILKHHEFVSEVLSIIAECVFATDGIVVDYQGDAVMAAWGAPISAEDHAERACESAASAVRRLAGLSFSTLDESGRKIPFGMGLTGGRVLAGNMATKEHIKYIVMGSAVNIASRLEGLTKHIRVPVLIGGSTARMVQGKTKLRRVAKVQPAGMASVLDAYELVLPEDCHGTGISDHNIEKYECALGCFEQGEMEKAEELLQALPVSDPVRRFLLLQAGQLIYSGVPPGWDGVIRFHSK